MLVAHGAIEPPLRGLVARGREMNGAEPLVGVFLAEGGLPAGHASRRGNGDGRR